MALLNKRNFVFTNNLSMRKALAKSSNVEVMAEMFDLDEDELRENIKNANWKIDSFRYIAENTNSTALYALMYRMREEGIR